MRADVRWKTNGVGGAGCLVVARPSTRMARAWHTMLMCAREAHRRAERADKWRERMSVAYSQRPEAAQPPTSVRHWRGEELMDLGWASVGGVVCGSVCESRWALLAGS